MATPGLRLRRVSARSYMAGCLEAELLDFMWVNPDPHPLGVCSRPPKRLEGVLSFKSNATLS